MPIPRTPMVDDDGSGTTGTILNNAWKTELYDQIDANPAWVPIPYSAGVFTGVGGMIWTVEAADLATFAYSIIGHVVIIQISISGCTISGTLTNELRCALPLTTPVNSQGIGRYTAAAGAFQPLLLYTVPGSAYLGLTPLSSINFVAGTNNQLMQGTIITQI